MYIISDSNITDSDTNNIHFISDTNNIRFFSDTVVDFSNGYRIFRIFLTALSTRIPKFMFITNSFKLELSFVFSFSCFSKFSLHKNLNLMRQIMNQKKNI